jgi:hypothetical protein
MSNEQEPLSSNPTKSDTLNARIASLSPKQKKFIRAYGECGVIKYACKAAGIHRSTFYDWRDNDENFKACLPFAGEDADDTLEYAAYEQSVLGTEEPAVSMGQLVYEYEELLDEKGKPVLDGKGKPVMKRGKQVMVKKYSPQLLITLLKARMPEKYKDKQQVDANINHSGSIDSKTIAFDPKTFTDDELKAMKEVLLRAVQREQE